MEFNSCFPDVILFNLIIKYLEMNSVLNLDNKNVAGVERIISALVGSYLVVHGLRKGRKLSEIPLGSILLFRGITGFCPVKQTVLGNGSGFLGMSLTTPHNINIETSVKVDRPREEVYGFWRKLENLPLFMKHLDSVTVIDEKNSLWSARIPGGLGTIDWESEITHDKKNERISWRSLPESEIRNRGNVEFTDLGNGTTEIKAHINYEAPGGIIGEKVSQLLNPVFGKMVKSDIKHFKKYLETSEVNP